VAERDESGSIIGVLATGQDVSERKRLQRELERQARFDFLTGLLNRRYFIELAKMELLRLKRNSGKLSLIMFDIDYFKQINDTHGHNTGDQVLKRVAHICHETVREIDIVGRLGGEEFVVLLPQTDKHQAFSIAERLRLAIVEQELKTDDGKEVHFTASFGVVTLNSDEIRHEKAIMIDDILIKVDKAMYQAKENGRNNVYQER
jgi:diguanylate cyclase (GGDEF)-like protein